MHARVESLNQSGFHVGIMLGLIHLFEPLVHQNVVILKVCIFWLLILPDSLVILGSLIRLDHSSGVVGSLQLGLWVDLVRVALFLGALCASLVVHLLFSFWSFSCVSVNLRRVFFLFVSSCVLFLSDKY